MVGFIHLLFYDSYMNGYVRIYLIHILLVDVRLLLFSIVNRAEANILV